MGDKHTCKVGEPGFLVAAAERGKQVIVGKKSVVPGRLSQLHQNFLDPECEHGHKDSRRNRWILLLWTNPCWGQGKLFRALFAFTPHDRVVRSFKYERDK